MLKRGVIVQPLLLAGILALGAGIVWAAIVAWCISIAEQVVRADRVRQDIHVRLDGTPVVRTYDPDSLQEYTDRTLRELGAQLLEYEGRQASLRGAGLSAPKRRKPLLLRLFFHLDWNQRIRAFNDGGRPATYWYFIHSGQLDGDAYFAGYNSKTELLVGYIGKNGFQRHKPPPERFPIDGGKIGYYDYAAIASASSYWRASEPYYYYGSYESPGPGRIPSWMVYLISDDGLLEIDLRNRSVRTLLESDQLVSVEILWQAPKAIPKEGEVLLLKQYVAVRTPDQILLLDSEGILHRRYTIPGDLRGEGFTFYFLSDEGAMLHLSQYREGISNHEFFWLDEQGNILKQAQESLHRGGFAEKPGPMSWLLCSVVPVPAIVTPVVTLGLPWQYIGRGGEPDYASALAKVLSKAWPALLAVHLVAVGLAWLCYRRQKEYAMHRTWLWTVLVFLFGLPGLLGYLFHRRWPVREACPECGQNAPRDRQSCSECGSQFPEPAPKGIEVFA